MRSMAALALITVGFASLAQAQTAIGQTPAQPQTTITAGPDGSFSDECGFRYNIRGDRIDA
jgi:hypothetical protein